MIECFWSRGGLIRSSAAAWLRIAVWTLRVWFTGGAGEPDSGGANGARKRERSAMLLSAVLA